LLFLLLGMLLLPAAGCSGTPETAEFGGIVWFCHSASGGTLRVEPAYDPIGETGRIFRSDLSGKVAVPEEIDGKLVTGLADRAFFGSAETTEVVLGNAVETIGKECFYGCTALRTVCLPESIRDCGQNAFSQSGIESFMIPEGLRSLGSEDSQPFFGCVSLQEILVAKENLYYLSESGVLFSKNKKTLLCYPAEKKGSAYVISDTVEKLAPGSFSGCAYLQSLTIPASVKKMENRFFGCEALKTLLVPETQLEDYRENPVLADFTGTLEGYTR